MGDINRIVKTNSIISSPACSLDRIKLESRNRTLAIVSPKNREDFIRYLKARNEGIDIDI